MYPDNRRTVKEDANAEAEEEARAEANGNSECTYLLRQKSRWRRGGSVVVGKKLGGVGVREREGSCNSNNRTTATERENKAKKKGKFPSVWLFSSFSTTDVDSFSVRERHRGSTTCTQHSQTPAKQSPSSQRVSGREFAGKSEVFHRLPSPTSGACRAILSLIIIIAILVVGQY